MKKQLRLVSSVMVLVFTLFSCTFVFGAQAVSADSVTIKWFGHSSFGISDSKGTKVVTDPYGEGLGYELPKLTTDILTLSHDHFDHNNFKALEKYSHLIEAPEKFSHNNVEVKGIASYHDEKKGELRGKNTIFVYTVNQVKICHLGDLGHALTKEQITAIGKVDVLMIPVGGLYTIDAETAAKVVGQINPKMVIPMHYKTDVLPAEFGDITKVDAFITAMKGWKVEKADQLTLTKKSVDQAKGKTIVMLSYK